MPAAALRAPEKPEAVRDGYSEFFVESASRTTAIKAACTPQGRRDQPCDVATPRPPRDHGPGAPCPLKVVPEFSGRVARRRRLLPHQGDSNSQQLYARSRSFLLRH